MTDQAARRLLTRSLEFLECFAGCFGRASQKTNCRRYIRGLLSDLPRKSMQPIVEALGTEARYQALHHFITQASWDTSRLWKQMRQMAPSAPGVRVQEKQCDQARLVEEEWRLR